MRAFAKTYFAAAQRIPAAILASSYLFGMLMLGHAVIDGFVYLTAPHLLLTPALLILTHRPKPSARLFLWVGVCFIIGWLAEYIGVHGKWLFGEYIYGDVLGPKVYGIPLVIGFNWIVVVYAICGTINILSSSLHRLWKVFIGGLCLVALDYAIEPVAISLDYWIWIDGAPPLQNFIGWFIIGILQTALFYAIIPYTENRLSPLLLLLQMLFFVYLTAAL